MDDFRGHMEKMAKPGLMQKMMGMLPGMGQLKEAAQMMNTTETSGQVRRMVGIIDSMTKAERKDPSIIDARRRTRIAAGSGAGPKQVSELIKQYDMMKGMMTGMAGMGNKDRMAKMQELQQAAMDPSRRGMPKTKKNTGKRLTKKERDRMQKERKKRLRQMKRDKKQGPKSDNN